MEVKGHRPECDGEVLKQLIYLHVHFSSSVRELKSDVSSPEQITGSIGGFKTGAAPVGPVGPTFTAQP